MKPSVHSPLWAADAGETEPNTQKHQGPVSVPREPQKSEPPPKPQENNPSSSEKE